MGHSLEELTECGQCYLPYSFLAPSECTMTTPDNSNAWSGAVQRELDGLQRSVDTRFSEFTTRLDKLLTLTEYYADKRSLDLRFENVSEKLEDSENDIQRLTGDVRQSLADLRVELQTQYSRLEKAIADEKKDRVAAIKEFVEARKSQFRWLVSMVMVPIGIALVQLLAPKK